MRNNSSIKFHIVDFSAGNFITHHLNYALTYSRFIQRLGCKSIVYVPKYLSSSVYEGDTQIERILFSGSYRFLARKFIVWRFYSLFIKRIGIFGIKFNYLVEQILTFVYIERSLRGLKKNLDMNFENQIVFPSTDLMAILLLKKMLTKKININSYFLRINAIDKNMSNPKIGKDGLSILDNLVRENSNIFIGCETVNLTDYIKTRNKLYKSVIWIPLPSITREKYLQKSYVFGFIGGAKKRKGFEEIPLWIKKISEAIPLAKYLVQGTPFVWPGYHIVLNSLMKNQNVEMLPEVLSNNEFFRQISRCKFIVTPYDSNSYKMVGSSLFYYASDLLVPTIAYPNLGFSEDIQRFKCGKIVFDIDSKLSFNADETDSFIAGLLRYNTFRNNQNLKFLNLK